MIDYLEMPQEPEVEYLNATMKTHVVSSILSIDQKYKSYLVDEIIKISDRSTPTNLTGDSSTFHLWNQIKCGELIDSIEHIANIPNLLPWIGQDLRDSKQIPQVVNEAWSSIYRKGDFAKKHHHNHAITAFVYYLHSSEEEDSPLVFEDGTHVKPKEGRLIFFPGALIHEVPPMQSDNERVIIAGNLFYNY
jgi:hypothetical protein